MFHVIKISFWKLKTVLKLCFDLNWTIWPLIFLFLRFPSCSVIEGFQMDTGTWMDMDRILSSWLMQMERQFIANSIIRYRSPLGKGVEGSYHPRLLTSPEDWARIKAWPSPPSPYLHPQEWQVSIWLVRTVIILLATAWVNTQAAQLEQSNLSLVSSCGWGSEQTDAINSQGFSFWTLGALP